MTAIRLGLSAEIAMAGIKCASTHTNRLRVLQTSDWNVTSGTTKIKVGTIYRSVELASDFRKMKGVLSVLWINVTSNAWICRWHQTGPARSLPQVTASLTWSASVATSIRHHLL